MKGLSAEARRGQIKAGEFSRPPTLDGSERLAIRCRHHWSRQHEKRLYGRSCRNDSQWRDNYGWIHGRRHVGAPSDELVKQHKSRLNVICSDAGAGKGVGKLFDAALVSILTASHIGLNPKAQQQMLAKQIVIELVPQGTLSAPAAAVLVACSRRPASGQVSRRQAKRCSSAARPSCSRRLCARTSR